MGKIQEMVTTCLAGGKERQVMVGEDFFQYRTMCMTQEIKVLAAKVVILSSDHGTYQLEEDKKFLQRILGPLLMCAGYG